METLENICADTSSSVLTQIVKYSNHIQAREMRNNVKSNEKFRGTDIRFTS